MAQRTVTKFLSDLKTSGLLTDQQQSQLDAEVRKPGTSTQAKPLARRLVKSGFLNRWQAEMLLQGQTGLMLGHYRMRGILGRGGMGTVFRALDPDNKQEVAIKVMARKLAKNEVLVTRFKREIQAAMAIDSPHVVKALDAGRVGHMLFLVMEVVNGGDLASIIHGKKTAATTGRVRTGSASGRRTTSGAHTTLSSSRLKARQPDFDVANRCRTAGQNH